MENLYAIYHCYDVDGGFGDAVSQDTLVGICYATQEEIDEFLAEWDKPEVYDKPYADLYHHCVRADQLSVSELKDIVPYYKGGHYPWAEPEMESEHEEEEE